jgi:adenylate kinase family enzyme
MHNILLIGTTGVGKTEIGRFIATQNNDWVHLSSGEEVKAFATEDDMEGFARGELFKDERLVRDILSRKINDLQVHPYPRQDPKSIILDGFPRTTEQLYYIMGACIPIDLAIYINVDFYVVEKRIKSRQRDYIDTIEAARNRTLADRSRLIELYNATRQFGIKQLWIDNSDGAKSVEQIYNYIVRNVDFLERI